MPYCCASSVVCFDYSIVCMLRGESSPSVISKVTKYWSVIQSSSGPRCCWVLSSRKFTWPTYWRIPKQIKIVVLFETSKIRKPQVPMSYSSLWRILANYMDVFTYRSTEWKMGLVGQKPNGNPWTLVRTNKQTEVLVIRNVDGQNFNITTQFLSADR